MNVLITKWVGGLDHFVQISKQVNESLPYRFLMSQFAVLPKLCPSCIILTLWHLEFTTL